MRDEINKGEGKEDEWFTVYCGRKRENGWMDAGRERRDGGYKEEMGGREGEVIRSVGGRECGREG